jgi:hypothetical protein
VLPVRAGIVAADGLAVEQERRDRLAERPGELAIVAGLALVDLRAGGIKGSHDGFARCCDRCWQLRESLAGAAGEHGGGGKRQDRPHCGAKAPHSYLLTVRSITHVLRTAASVPQASDRLTTPSPS